MAITEAPFDEDGNMVSYPGAYWVRPVKPFKATMEVVGMEVGRSAKRLVLKDVETGKTYPLFVADIVKILEGVPITGTWSATKRGANYGIKREKVR